MNPKKYLENRILGWLPKEPHSPSCQSKTNHKPPKIGIQVGIVIFVMGFVGGLLGAFASSLGLFSGLGVYVVSVVVIVIGITIVAATIIIRTQQKKEQQRICSDMGAIKKYLENHVRGWLPKTPSMAIARKTPKPRWRNPYWMAFVLVVVVAMSVVTFVGVRAYMHYSNPAMDVAPIPYYEKTTNSTIVGFGDIVEVNVWVYWHGYVFPEFKRNVKIVDPFPESRFSLASENETNVCQSQGYGGSYHVKYLLRVVGGNGESVEFPEPRLYLDGVEIPLSGTSPTVNITSK